jgi:hypothetical protein
MPVGHQSHDDLGAEPSKGKLAAWSISGTLTAGDFDKSVSLQALFAEPGDYTVQLSGIFPPANVLVPIQPEAEIIWSVAGNSISRKVSVGSGISISGNAEAVRVVVKDVTNLFGGPLTDYEVSITICKGTRAAIPIPPTLLVPLAAGFGGLNPGAAVDIPIPQGVGITSVHVSIAQRIGVPIPEQAIQVLQRGAGGIGTLQAYDPRAIGWCPMAPAAVTLRIKNWTAGIVDFAVTFGIDG